MADASAKIRVKTDTSEVRKGLTQVSSDIKSFEKQSSGALRSLGAAFGFNTDQIGKMSAAFSGAAGKMMKDAGKSNDSILKVTKTIGKVGIAIGAAAAAVGAAWKAMGREADYYASRMNGMADAAGLRQYRQTLQDLRHDHANGSGILDFVEGVKNKWNEATLAISNYLRYGREAGKVQTAKDKEAAAASAEDAKALANLQIKNLTTQKAIASLESKIRVDREIASDKTLDYAERMEAVRRVEENIRKVTGMKAGMLSSEINLRKSLNSYAESDFAAVSAVNSLEIQKINLLGEEADQLRSIQKVTREIQTGYEAITASRETMIARIDSRSLLSGAKATTGTAGIARPIVEEVQQTQIDLMPMFEDSMRELAAAFGEMWGDIFSGEGVGASAASFGATVLSMIGGLATKFGEYAVGIGLASESIKKAFHLNGAPAIAAGLALIALGQGLSAWASNVTSGSYSTGASGVSYATSGGSYGGSGYTERELNIKVSGALVASGSQLVAVLDNEANRKNKTT